MKKSVSLLITALLLCTALSVPAFAADEAVPGKDSCYYPISVDEYTYGPLDELRIDKVYQLSLGDDPGGIPTEDFVRGGRLYFVVAKSAPLRFRLRRKLRSLPCSSSPHKIFDFVGAPL